MVENYTKMNTDELHSVLKQINSRLPELEAEIGDLDKTLKEKRVEFTQMIQDQKKAQECLEKKIAELTQTLGLTLKKEEKEMSLTDVEDPNWVTRLPITPLAENDLKTIVFFHFPNVVNSLIHEPEVGSRQSQHVINKFDFNYHPEGGSIFIQDRDIYRLLDLTCLDLNIQKLNFYTYEGDSTNQILSGVKSSLSKNGLGGAFQEYSIPRNHQNGTDPLKELLNTHLADILDNPVEYLRIIIFTGDGFFIETINRLIENNRRVRIVSHGFATHKYYKNMADRHKKKKLDHPNTLFRIRQFTASDLMEAPRYKY